MQVREIINEGLKREIQVTVPVEELLTKRDAQLLDLKDKIKINGFRPGRVPRSQMIKLYGKSSMADLINKTIDQETKRLLSDRSEKAAQKPQIIMVEDEIEVEKILSGEKDFVFSIQYEIIPSFEITDFSDLKVEHSVIKISDEDIDEKIENMAKNNLIYETKQRKADYKDRVTIDYTGAIDGDPFEDGMNKDAHVFIGTDTFFIPGFEEQLIGMEAGDKKCFSITFPDDYHPDHLASMEAVFHVTVHEVATPGPLMNGNQLAKSLGLDNLSQLKEGVKKQMEKQYVELSRQKLKRQLLDFLDKEYQFELPKSMVEQEFKNIWTEVVNTLEEEGKTFEDDGTTEKEAREDYQELAHRRVRLGLILNKIAEEAGIKVTESELHKGVYQHLQKYPGSKQKIIDLLKSNSEAASILTAPIFEEKVIDYIIKKANVVEKNVRKEEFMNDHFVSYEI